MLSNVSLKWSRTTKLDFGKLNSGLVEKIAFGGDDEGDRHGEYRHVEGRHARRVQKLRARPENGFRASAPPRVHLRVPIREANNFALTVDIVSLQASASKF
jgi:hypothetical protein